MAALGRGCTARGSMCLGGLFPTDRTPGALFLVYLGLLVLPGKVTITRQIYRADLTRPIAGALQARTAMVLTACRPGQEEILPARLAHCTSRSTLMTIPSIQWGSQPAHATVSRRPIVPLLVTG